MNLPSLRRLYDYNDWANGRIVSVLSTLDEESFNRPIVSSFPSIRETLAHVIFSEWLWLKRWKGVSPPGVPHWMNVTAFSSMEQQMRDIAEERRAFLAELSAKTLESTLHYANTQGDPMSMPLAGLLIHCANHSTHHRGQLVTMLRQTGVQPPNTDYTQFLRS